MKAMDEDDDLLLHHEINSHLINEEDILILEKLLSEVVFGVKSSSDSSIDGDFMLCLNNILDMSSLEYEFLNRYIIISRNEELAKRKSLLLKKRLVLEYLTVHIFLSYKKNGKSSIILHETETQQEDFANLTKLLTNCGIK